MTIDYLYLTNCIDFWSLLFLLFGPLLILYCTEVLFARLEVNTWVQYLLLRVIHLLVRSGADSWAGALSRAVRRWCVRGCIVAFPRLFVAYALFSIESNSMCHVSWGAVAGCHRARWCRFCPVWGACPGCGLLTVRYWFWFTWDTNRLHWLS